MKERAERAPGPDFLTSVSECQTVPFKLVDLLANRGFAISISFWKRDDERRPGRDQIAINASPNARVAWDRVVITPKYWVLESLDFGFWPGGRIGNFYKELDSTNWDERTKKSLLALYEFNLQRKYGRSEDWSREKARGIIPVDVDKVRESILGHLEKLVEDELDQKVPHQATITG